MSGYVAPQNGSLTLCADGSFEYTPDPGFEGTDSFTYRAFTNVQPLPPPPITPTVFVSSDPATVVVIVGCLTSVDNDCDSVLDAYRRY